MAASHRGMLSTRSCRRSTGILAHWSNKAHWSNGEFMEVMWGMIHVVDCTPQFVPRMFDGVTVRRLCRLVHFSDVHLLQIISHYPGTMRRIIVILVAKIIFKVLPRKWYQSVPEDVPIHHAIDVPIQEHKGWFVILLNAPRQGQNPPPPSHSQVLPPWWLAVNRGFQRILQTR